MRFAHIADCHIGGWRDKKMQEASIQSFIHAMDICIKRKVDFVLISGDLFNTAVPSIDKLKVVFIKFDELKKAGIRLYYIPGSHDFSPSGNTMLDLIELAGLGKNAMRGDISPEGRFMLDPIKDISGAVICGVFGRKGALEGEYLKNIDTSKVDSMGGYKIFMFHTAITELKTKDLEMMDSLPMSVLPDGFDYYAGGHVHVIADETRKNSHVAYPGPLFPNSFSEFEKLGHGGFYIVDDGIEYIPIRLYKHYKLNVDCDGLSAAEVNAKILNRIKDKDFIDAIITLRLSGALESGKTTDIEFREFFSLMREKGAYFIMRNISRLKSAEYEDVKVDESTAPEIEDSIINKNLGKSGIDMEAEKNMIKCLIEILSSERKDGEKVFDFEERIKKDALKALDIE